MMFLYEDGANPDEDLGEVDSTETEGVAVSKYVLNCVFHALLLHCTAVRVFLPTSDCLLMWYHAAWS